MRKISVLLIGILCMACQTKSFKTESNGIIVSVKQNGVNIPKSVRLQVYSDDVIRVSATTTKGFSKNGSLIVIDKFPKVKFTVNESENKVILHTSKLQVEVSTQTGEVTFNDSLGKPLLKEKAGGGKSFIAIKDGDKDKYSIRQVFESNDTEEIYGLGQQQYNLLSYKGTDIDLFQYNTKVSIPFIVSGNNYGILWDNYSYSKFGDIRDYKPISAIHLTSPDGKEGFLEAKYVSKTDTTHVFFKRYENDINYEFLDQQKLVPEGFKMDQGEVIWTGTLSTDTSSVFKFRFYAAGYTKVWVNGNLVVDRWRQCWNATTSLFNLQMEKGIKYPIKVEWIPDAGESYVSLKCLNELEGEKNTISLYSQVADQIDYYFIKGDNIDSVISGYRYLTGKASILPKWAMGFWQSRERYKSQDEILNTVKEFRKRGIPLDNIVLDWQYWKDDQWGSHEFDEKRFPSPKGMIDELHHNYNTQLMISVWPKFYTGTRHYDEMNEKGWLYKLNVEKNRKDWIGYVSTFYDAFNPEGRQLYWKQINEHLFSLGIDGWWLDASEPDMCSNLSIKERQDLMNPTALGSGAEYFNAFPLVNAKGVYEGQRNEKPDQRVFILTRSAFAGQQRYASATWSGDVGSRWEELKLQIPAALNFSMSGLPYWTMDIGGFAVEKRFENARGELLEEWRELMLRWFQFGAFCPIFRVHGQFPYREMYNVAPENHEVYKSLLAYDKLRYKLMPYIYSLAGHTYHNNYTIMRALVMDFASDSTAHKISDQYMFGPSILVSPVYDYKVRERKVYLPASTDWYDMNTGKPIRGGQFIQADASLKQIPLFIKAGSIVPTGKNIQYTSQTNNDTITLYVYAGANGSFNLYEDENTNYNYEKGDFTEIPLKYDNASKTLTIGKRIGKFNGMLQNRVFQIVFVNKTRPVSFSSKVIPNKTINYNGQEVNCVL